MSPDSELTDGLVENIKSFLSNQRKILIVEDDPERIIWMQKHLTPGHAATIATNGEAAYHVLCSDQQWDVIFLDHDLMPEHITVARGLSSWEDYMSWKKDYEGPLTGFDLACWIAGQEWSESLPVLIHSMNRYGSAAIKKVLSSSIQTPFEELKKRLSE